MLTVDAASALSSFEVLSPVAVLDSLKVLVADEKLPDDELSSEASLEEALADALSEALSAALPVALAEALEASPPEPLPVVSSQLLADKHSMPFSQ